QRAPKLLSTLRTPEGTPLPPNALAEMGRDLARLHFVEGQIREIETARLERFGTSTDRKIARHGAPLGSGHWDRHRDGGHARSRGHVAQFARPTGGGTLRWSDGGTGRERFEAAGKGPRQSRQRESAARHDPAGVALPDVSEGKRTRAVVPLPDGRCPSRHAEVADRCHG